jgi:hypothetical protein
VLINIHKIPRDASDQSWRGAIPVSIGLLRSRSFFKNCYIFVIKQGIRIRFVASNSFAKESCNDVKKT